MRPGEKAKVVCPGVLDKGGNIDQYVDNSSSWVHTYTDMTYEIQLMACAEKFKPKKPSRIAYPLVPGKCMYILSE